MNSATPTDEPVTSDSSESGESNRSAGSRDRAFLFVAVGVLVVAILVGGVLGYGVYRDRRASRLAASGAEAFSKGQFESSANQLSGAVKVRSQDATAQALLGRSFEARGDLDAASKAYAASLAVNPKQPELLFKVAVIEKTQKDVPAAITTLNKAIALAPTFTPARLLLADLYAAQGDKAAAREQLSAVIAIAPLGVDLKVLQKRRDALK